MGKLSLSTTAAVLASLLSAAACGRAPATTQFAYPPTRAVDAVDDYHGKKVPDPYRWLEDLSSAEVREWAQAQMNFAVPLIRKNDVYPWLVQRIEALGKAWDVFDSATKSGESDLIDPKTLGEGVGVLGTWASPDRRHVAYTVSEGGSDWSEMRIRRMADGRDLPERLDGLLWAEAAWTRDSGGFFYQRSQRPDSAARTMVRAPAVYYHRIGSPQSDDVVVFRTAEESTDLVVNIGLSDDRRDLFVYEGNGADVPGLGWLLTRMHVLDLGAQARPVLTNRIVPLVNDRAAGYRVIASEGNTWFMFTDRGAARRRLVAVDRRRPSPDQWQDVIPEAADVLDFVAVVGERFVAIYRHDVQDAVRVFDRSGRLVRELAIDPLRTVLNVEAGRSVDELLVDTTSFVVPPMRSRHNLRSGAVVVEMSTTPPPSAADIEVRQLWYPSKDGTRVPMFVLYRRGLVRDGSHPTLLYGYGASGTSAGPEFTEHVIAWIEMGGVFAMPAIRGGGEFGRAWYEAAILERKQTTFDDFIAAAESLIAERYTSREQLVAQGRSNGGLLVAAVMTQRPDLFRVAIADVPIADTLRYDRGRHIPQFGSAQDPAQFEFLFAYSPQQHVKTGTCYPATLVTTTLNDDRAPAWLPMKFAAALQAAQSCNRPVALRANPSGGHRGNFAADIADALAFAARELGMRPPGTPAR